MPDLLHLDSHINDIQAGIRSGRFVNEASISQGIILRLLQALGWPTFDTQVVWPEYTLEGRRVDFALCHPKNRPAVFVEAKQIGQSEGSERQLFEYAFHLGVPMAILTDGQEWQFFLPAEQGLYQERRVYKLDLLERSVEESVFRLQRYLAYTDVCSGKAMDAARADYRNVSRERTIATTLPSAWQKLLEEQDSQLLELLIDKVESLCGYKPDEETVSNFLAQQAGTTPPRRQPRSSTPPAPPQPSIRPAVPVIAVAEVNRQPGRHGCHIGGTFYPAATAKEVMVTVFEQFCQQDPTFGARFIARPKHGRKRRYLAATKEELYPGRPDLAELASYRLRNGLWLGTNASSATIETIIQMACEVAGLTYGQDVVLELG